MLELHDKRDPADGRREKPNGGGEDMKYTKGPWRIDSDVNHQSESIRHSIVASSGRLIAWVLKHYDRDEKFQKTSAQDDADAALIAAAPKLLEACKEALKVLVYPSAIKDTVAKTIYKKVHAAIAAAEGRDENANERAQSTGRS